MLGIAENEVRVSAVTGVGYKGKNLVILGLKHTWDSDKKLYFWYKPNAAPQNN